MGLVVPFLVPMTTTTIVDTYFSAAHSVPGYARCEEKHGHTWFVSVEIAGDETTLVDVSLSDIPTRIAEYDKTDLDRYLPGVRTTEVGLARFFRERLSDFPVTAITVRTHGSGQGVKIVWEHR